MSRYIQRVLFREPSGGSGPWSMLAAGCFGLLVGLFITFSQELNSFIGPMNVALGLAFVLGGASHLSTGERKTAITLLRASFLVLLLTATIFATATIAVEVAKVWLVI